MSHRRDQAFTRRNQIFATVPFHFVSSGLRWLRSRPQLHCASSTVIPSGPVKKNSWRSWNALSSPRTSTPLDMRILNHSFDIIDRKANVIEAQLVEPRNVRVSCRLGASIVQELYFKPGRGAG